MSRPEYEPGSLDLALEYLRGHELPYKWHETDLYLWEAVCPACITPEWGLTLREPVKFGPISVRCKSGCSAEQIKQALEREPIRPQIEAAEAEAAEAWQVAEQTSEIAHRALELAAVGDDR